MNIPQHTGFQDGVDFFLPNLLHDRAYVSTCTAEDDNLLQLLTNTHANPKVLSAWLHSIQDAPSCWGQPFFLSLMKTSLCMRVSSNIKHVIQKGKLRNPPEHRISLPTPEPRSATHRAFPARRDHTVPAAQCPHSRPSWPTQFLRTMRCADDGTRGRAKRIPRGRGSEEGRLMTNCSLQTSKGVQMLRENGLEVVGIHEPE